MKRRGFTLIELLAVIVILSVIAIITVPMVMNVIEESKRDSFKVTCNQIYRAYEQYEISNELIGTTGTCTVFDFGSTRTETEIIDGIRYEPISKLNLKGEMPKLGTYKICNDTRNLVIDNGIYTCVKDGTREEILEGSIADNDLTAPILNDITLSSTSNSIRVIVDATETDGLITKYVYKLNGEEKVSSNNTYTFERLSGTEEFTVEVYVENKSGLKSESISKSIRLKGIEPTTYEESQTPEETEYATSKKIKIKYDTQKGIEKYFKSNVEVVAGVVVEECGNETDPGTCTTSNATTLEAGTWYKTTNTNPNITYTSNGKLYALTSDGKNISVTSTYTISKISTGTPTTPTITGGSEDWTTTSRTISVSTASNETSEILKYQYYISTSSSSQTGGSWIDCSTSTTSQTITTNGTNYIFFRAVANNGNVSGVSNYQVTKISSNSYTKAEIDSLVNELTKNVQTNTTNINSAQSDLNAIDLSKYATQQELTNTNNRVNQLSETIKSNSDRLTALEN